MVIQSLVVAGDSLLEVDHILVCVETVPNIHLLREVGLICSDRTVQRQEQGTVSSLVFFENAYLELIWVEDADAAENYAMRSGIDFLARSLWQATKASPFGIALRQKLNEGISNTSKQVLSQRAITERSETFVNFASDNLVTQAEPLCFIIPDSVSLIRLLDRSLDLHRQLITHPLGLNKLTQTKVTIEPGKLTDPIAMLLTEEIIQVEQNAEPQLELTFDHGRQDQRLDLRWLGIPIMLKY